MSSADYVIVGAGSAGCVLANRLSEDPGTRVLLLEAGGKDSSINIKIPLAFPKQFHTKLDWDFSTEPEPGCDGRRLYVPRGKSLGGSSSMNAMLYVRGRPWDYDLWESQGAAGWGWADVLPYFRKAENNSRGASEYHGVGGPVEVTDPRSPRPLSRDIIASFEAHGTPYVADYNGPEQDGVAMFQVFQKGGRRWSCADAYLRPAMSRPNLEVVTGAQVLGLELDGDRVTGVRYRKGRRELVARADAEVLLSAGAIGSPQVLQTSGIGPAAVLEGAGVAVRHELEGVGRNLQDHPFVTVTWEVDGDDHGTLFGADGPGALLEWALRRSGKLTSTAAEVTAFVRTRGGLPAADVQFHAGGLYFEDHGAEEHERPAAVLAPTLIAPRSRGEVTIRSADPTAKPRILTNSLTEQDDVDSMVAAIEMAREVAGRAPLRDRFGTELKPGSGVSTREDLEADLRRRVELLYHPSCTCRIGTDEDAVVDPELRVRGLEGLRVVDASVFPVVPGGNTNAPTIMVAERAADLVRGRVQAPAGAAA